MNELQWNSVQGKRQGSESETGILISESFIKSKASTF